MGQLLNLIAVVDSVMPEGVAESPEFGYVEYFFIAKLHRSKRLHSHTEYGNEKQSLIFGTPWVFLHRASSIHNR